MNKLIIINGKLILPDGIREGKALVCEGKTIEKILPMTDLQVDATDIVIDGGNNFVSPGFIDIHTHGGGGHDFMDATVEAFLGAAGTHARFGTTAMLPTTLASTTDELLKLFPVYKAAVAQNTKGSKFLGLHLEGPYFSYNQRGAQDPEYLRNPEPEEYLRILEASDDIVRWSLAPELDGAFAFGELLRSKHILPSVAHSDAIYEEVEKAFQSGFTHITHLYSGMSSVMRRNAFRYAGVVEAAYLIDDITVEIIADGVHLPKALLQFAYKFKGPDQTALCTDSMRAAGMPDGEYILGSHDKGRKVIVEDGVAKLPDRSAFAGSVATTDRLVRTMVDIAGVPLIDAVKMMTITPARIIHMDSTKGSFKEGKDADIVIFDENINVLTTIIEGNVIYKQ